MSKVLRAVSAGLLPRDTYVFEAHHYIGGLEPEYVCVVKCQTTTGLSITTTWTQEEFDRANDIFQWYPTLPEYVI